MRLFIHILCRKGKSTPKIFLDNHTEVLSSNDGVLKSINSNQLQEDELVDKSRSYKCSNPGCNRSYNNETSLYRHMRWMCQKPPMFKCPYCVYKAYQTSNVRRHIKSVHKGQEVRVIQIEEKDGRFIENTSGTSGFPEVVSTCDSHKKKNFLITLQRRQKSPGRAQRRIVASSTSTKTRYSYICATSARYPVLSSVRTVLIIARPLDSTWSGISRICTKAWKSKSLNLKTKVKYYRQMFQDNNT